MVWELTVTFGVWNDKYKYTETTEVSLAFENLGVAMRMIQDIQTHHHYEMVNYKLEPIEVDELKDDVEEALNEQYL